MPKRETIKTLAETVPAALPRRGIAANARVTPTVETGIDAIPGRRDSRVLVRRAGLSDADLDALIKHAQHEVEQPLS